MLLDSSKQQKERERPEGEGVPYLPMTHADRPKKETLTVRVGVSTARSMTGRETLGQSANEPRYFKRG